MDALIARYLDGTLSDREADELLQAAAADPRLEHELKSYEALLAGALSLPSPEPSDTFTDDVMERVAEATQHHVSEPPPLRQPRRFASFPTRALALAASLVVLFAVGYRVGQMGSPVDDAAPTVRVAAAPATSGVIMPVALPGDGDSATPHQLVRFAAQPAGADVRTVSVAGSFNNWDPVAAPMRREGDVWVAYLLLPRDLHEYMFVENGDTWVTDPAASRTLNDGFGNENAVLDLML